MKRDTRGILCPTADDDDDDDNDVYVLQQRRGIDSLTRWNNCHRRTIISYEV